MFGCEMDRVCDLFVCWVLLLGHVLGVSLPWDSPWLLLSGVCLGTQLALTPVSPCIPIWPHIWIVLGGVTPAGLPSQWYRFMLLGPSPCKGPGS